MLTRAGWRSEWLVVRRHPLVWAAIAGAIAFLAMAAANEAPRNQRELFEAVLRLNLFVPAFVLPVVAGALAPIVFLREVEHGLGELFAAYPQVPRAWLAVRLAVFSALLFATCTALQLVIAGTLALDYPGHLAALAWRSAELAVWVQLPACLIWSSLLAWLSCARGKSGLVYFAAAFGWAAYLGLATLTGSPLIAGSLVAWQPLRTAMLLADPYAITALVNPPPLAGLPLSRDVAMLLGRLGWLALCLALLRGIDQVPALNPAHDGATPRSMRWSALPAAREGQPGLLMLSLRWVLRDKFALLAIAGWALLVFPEVFSGMRYAEPLAVLSPDSRDALNRVMWDLLPALGALVLLYAADRVSRMAGSARLAELVAATPYASWRLVAVQLACLWLVAAALLALTLLIVAAAQLTAWSPVALREYLEQGAQALPGLLLAATLFAALHAVLRSRLAANLAGLVLFVLGHSSLMIAMGLDHPLWKPLNLPLDAPDRVLGLGNNWNVLGGYGPLWVALCAGGLLLAVRLHHRGTPWRQATPVRALLHPLVPVAALLLAGGAWQGARIHQRLAADHALTSADERARRRADYELRYAEWEGRPQPQVAAVRTRVDFAADGRSVELRADLALVNRTAAPIARILVGRNQTEVAGDIAIDGTSAEARDPHTGQIVFRLDQPMRPGDKQLLHFAARIRQSGLSDAAGLMILRPEFATIPAFQILPVIGFQRELTLRDPARRGRLGLPPLNLAAPSQMGAATGLLADRQATFETVLSVPSGQSAIAPGDLVRQWRSAGRDHFLFRTDRPIRNLPLFAVVPWPVQRWPAGSLTTEIYAPDPVGKDSANLLAMRDTLVWLDRDVAPYPGTTLRLIAAPETGPSGYAFPQGMLISDRRGFRARPAGDAGFDQAYRRAVHETAHQWFGHLLGYGLPQERAFLIESLAKYAELVMIERRYGTPAMQALVDWEADRLAHARLVPAEVTVPLIDAEDTEDMYSRATLAFACLRQRLGDKAIVGALHDLAETTRQSGHPARSLDFVLALKRRGGKEYAAIVDMLLVDQLAVEAALKRSGCPVSS